jgi:hypothetical protein
LYKYTGVDPQTGYYSFTNAKGVTNTYSSGLTDADKTQFLDLSPKYYGGIQNTLHYKQLSLDFSFVFTNRMGLNQQAQSPYIPGYMNISGAAVWMNRWQNPGDITEYPRVSTSITNFYSRLSIFKTSTGAYSNASYARLQNLSLHYNLSPKLLKQLRLHNLSIYVQGQNLFTISHYGGLDPENLSGTTIPPMRVFTGGFNITI